MTAQKQLSSKWLVLFGMPFLLAGLGVTGWGVHAWMLYAASGSWQRVPATVQSVEFVEHSDSDGDTYSVKATYPTPSATRPTPAIASASWAAAPAATACTAGATRS